MLFIGDIHGYMDIYKLLIQGHEESYQVGDLGMEDDYSHLKHVALTHRFIKGNHDNYSVSDPHDLGDYGVVETSLGKMGFVRGALSIDRNERVEGVEWFPNEELNYSEMSDAVEFLVNGKPDIMLTHDVPQQVMTHLFGYPDKSMTRNGLQALWSEHKPKLWVFGHHHQSRMVEIEGTNFVCVGTHSSVEFKSLSELEDHVTTRIY